MSPSLCFPPSSADTFTSASYLFYPGIETERIDGGRLGLGLFIMIGIVVSYLPQFARIVQLKSSRGISPGFLLFGSVGGAAGLGNIILLQASLVQCCFTDWSPLMCFENTLGLWQVSVQVSCFWIFLFLFILYFPRPTIEQEEEDLTPTVHHVDAPLIQDDTNNDSTEAAQDLYAHALKTVNVIILAILGFFFITAVCLYVPEWRWNVAAVFGLINSLSAVVLFVPQILQTLRLKTAGALSVPTLCMQVPGNFLFAFSIFLSPGANATSYIPLIMTGAFQLVLLCLCVHYNRIQACNSEAEERVGLLE